MSSNLISKGALGAICKGEDVTHPVVRVDGIHMMKAEKEKARLTLYDGDSAYSFCMLSPKYNDKIKSNELKTGTLLRIDKYLTKNQNNRVIILLAEIHILEGDNLVESNNSTAAYTSSEPQLNRQPVIQTSISPNSVPIQYMNSYMSHWTIKGRVVSKSQIRTWSNARGDGKLFSFELADETSDMKVTAFNREADRFFDSIITNHAYSITKGQVKPSNRQFNKTKCDFELILTNESEVKELMDNENVIPKIHYNFVNIGNIKDCDENSIIDVVGVAHEINDASTVISKTKNVELTKRELVLVDRTKCGIRVTLWGDNTKLVDGLSNPTIVMKNAIVKSFNGRSLSAGNNILINSSDIPEALSLAGWYQEEGKTLGTLGEFNIFSGGLIGSASDSSKISTLSDVAKSGVSGNMDDKGEYFTVDAYVSQIRQRNLVYKACSTESCNKKLEETNPGVYFCPKCEQNIDDFKFRMMLSMKISDHTDSQWVTGFNDTGSVILNKSGDEIGKMEECQEAEQVDRVVKDALFGYYRFKLRSKMEMFQDSNRLKLMVVNVDKIDMLMDIDRMLAILSH